MSDRLRMCLICGRLGVLATPYWEDSGFDRHACSGRHMSELWAAYRVECALLGNPINVAARQSDFRFRNLHPLVTPLE